MYIAKIKFDGKTSTFGSKALKAEVNMFGFRISSHTQKNQLISNVVGTLFGSEKQIKKFNKLLKADTTILHFELNDNFFIATIKEPIYLSQVYSNDLIQTEPAFISNKGEEIITIGSFKKQLLTDSINVFITKYDAEIISLKQKKVRNISIMGVLPELTTKQKKAIELAVKEGYYDFPRRISVQELARLAGLSFSTFQVHLRKAESKIIPTYIN